MKESGVGAFARAARWIALAAVALFVGAGTLHAQATGKLEGRIRDQAGAPIPGAQVRVEGTAFGAVADNQGYYFINNVPAGVLDLVARFVGYKPVRVTGLRMVAGQTITQDFALEQTPVELEEITNVAAENVLVPRDAVTTKQRIDGDFAEKLPVDRIASTFALVPGVQVQSTNSINIRGGRNDEAVVYIDGVPVTPGGRGGQFVGTSAGRVDVSVGGFEDASVTTGASSSEFGNAQSGVIAIQTRAGGSKWNGNFGYEGDQVGGKNASVGFNRIQGGVGGPIFGNLTFYLSGDVEGQRSAGQGKDAQNYPYFINAGVDTTVSVISGNDTSFVDVAKYAIYSGDCGGDSKWIKPVLNSSDPGIANNYGVDCQGARLPAAPTSSYRLSTKFQYTFGAGNRVALTALRSQAQFRNFSYANLYNPQALTGGANYNNVVTANWTQNLSKSADRALALDVSASYQWDRALAGPLTRSGEESSRDPFGGFLIKPLDFKFDFDNFDITNMDANFRKNSGVLSPYDLTNTTQYQLVDQYRNNAYGLTGFSEGGGPTGRLSLYKEDRAIGKANLDWQLDRYNRVKLGGEYTKYFINAYSSGLTSQAFSDAYHETPNRYNVFMEDRLDLGDVVLVAGLRYDYYKTGAERPYYTDPTTGDKSWFPRISSMPGYNPATQDTLFVADKSHDYLSPHIQVAFPVTERTNFRLSYAHQVQTPDFNVILGGINTDLSVTNTNHFYGSDLDFGRTIAFEFGIRHSFSDDMVIDLSAYNKDKLADAAGRLVSYYDPQRKQNSDIRVMTNADFGNIRGFELRLDRRIGELFNGNLSYTFEDAKNTGSDPFTYLNFGSRLLNSLGGGNNPPPQAAQTTNQSRPHTLAGGMALTFPNNWKQGSTAGKVLENVGLFATFRFASGTPYSRCPADIPEDDNVFAGTVCSRNIEGDYNGARLPGVKQFDMRFTKGFGIRGLDVLAYADIRNLFNFTNVTSVYAQTADIKNNRERDKTRSADLDEFRLEAAQNGVYSTSSGTVDLSFGGAADPRQSCGGWVNSGGTSATPNCVYMIRAEQRYGNGDHLFTTDEQTRASDALFYTARGVDDFYGAPRRIRLGVEVSF